MESNQELLSAEEKKKEGNSALQANDFEKALECYT